MAEEGGQGSAPPAAPTPTPALSCTWGQDLVLIVDPEGHLQQIDPPPQGWEGGDGWRGLPFWELWSREEVDLHRHWLAAAVSGGCQLRQELRRGALWLELLLRPLHDARGTVDQVLIIERDITSRKQEETLQAGERSSLEQRVAERTLELQRANAELARASRLKDEFLANMSHELRTPLNAILGMSEILGEGLHGPLSPPQTELVENIHKSGRHLLDLINDVLDLAKIEAGKMTLRREATDLDELCNGVLYLIRNLAGRRHIRVIYSTDPAIGELYADPRAIKQILLNLLNNAVKFTPEHGQVQLTVEGDSERSQVRIIVDDTGIGIPADRIGELFRPFVQIDGSFSRQQEGSGLGLALVYRLTELHGGSIGVESLLGRGSCFTVTLPWEEAEVRRPEVGGGRASGAQGGGAEVLLAEDNELNAEILRGYLEGHGYRVKVARDGPAAVGQACSEAPDLILMDVQLPGIDGLEAIRQIRADASGAEIPVIAITALAMPGDRERCLAAGANSYFSKPVPLGKLVGEIEGLLGR